MWNVSRVGNFIEDDTLISLRYSARLLGGQGLTFTGGERVEGYSNLSWVLLNAGLGALGVDLIHAARFWAAASTAVAFLAALALVRRFGGMGSALLAGVLLGSTAPFAVWLTGALEQPLLLACLAVALFALMRLGEQALTPTPWAWAAGGALALLVLTRPDMPLFVVLLTLALPVLLSGKPWGAVLRVATVIAGLPLAAWLAQLGFRLAYYGQWVPNTAFVKATVTAARAHEGLVYVREGLEVAWLPSLFGAAGLVFALFEPRTRRWAAVLALTALAWMGYVAAIGGDHFPAWRHLLIVYLILAILAGLGAAALAKRWRRLRLAAPALAVLAAALVPAYSDSQWKQNRIDVARRARWQWEGQAVGGSFGAAFAREQPLYAVTAAGCLPYFSRLPALDLLGLTDQHIARAAPSPRMPLAHDHGDGRYVLARAPDLITFGLPRGGGPVFKSGEEMAADPRFSRDYRRVRFRTLEPLTLESESYVRLRGRIGVRLEGARVIIPGYLFFDVRGLPTPDGGMGAFLRERRRVSFEAPEVPAGSFRARLEPPNPHVTVRLSRRGGARDAEPDPRPDELTLDRPGPVRVELGTANLSTVIGRVVLEPTGSTAGPSAREAAEEALPREDLPVAPGFGVWSVSGEAFGAASVTARRPGQGVVEDAPGAFLDSFVASTRTRSGDEATGLATSPPFVPSREGWLALTLAGGRAEGWDAQMGVRLVELVDGGRRRVVRFVASGERDERMRWLHLDLGWLAGRTLALEVFDDSTANWGHISAGGFSLHGVRLAPR